MLLSSSETWVSIPKKTLKILDDLYTFMYRVFFRCGTGTPKMNYYWQCAILRVPLIILQEKILFAWHQANLPPGTLGRDCFDLQLVQLPPHLLASEIEEHLQKLDFTNSRYLTKFQFKARVKRFIVHLNKRLTWFRRAGTERVTTKS